MCKRTVGVLLLVTAVLCPVQPAHAQAGVAVVDFHAPEDQLREYVEQALEAHPTIRAARARSQAVFERVPQATALPDPMLSFGQSIRSIETRVGPQLNTFGISQTFPWRGTRGLRGEVVLREADAAEAVYRAQQREVVVRVKKAFYDLAYVDQAIRLTREEQSLLEHYERLAQSRYATGQGLQQAVLRTQAEITKVMNRLYALGQERTSRVAELNSLMDRPHERTIPEVPRLDIPVVDPDPQVLRRLGEQHRQEIQAAEALIERSERSIDLAQRDVWPDLVVGAGFVNVGKRDDQDPTGNGKNALTLSLGFSIPLRRDKYDAAVDEAGFELEASRLARAAEVNEMRRSIEDLVGQIRTYQKQSALFEQVLIPQAREALSSTEAAYETGQVGTLDLLDSERVLLDVRLLHERHYADYLTALARLERTIGTSFPRGED